MAKLTREELYWQKRNEELEAKWFKKSQKEIEKELAAYYAQALKHIEKDINDLYARFANDNAMDMVAAQRLLQGKEFQVWRMDMQEYLDEIEKTNSRKLLLELNTLAMRSRITRLDKLKAETYVELSKLAEKFGMSMKKFLPSAYKDFYYRNLFEIGKKRGLDSTPVKVDSEKLADVLRTPWSGKNYSDRIWANQEKLAKVLNNEVISAMHRGSSVDKISQIITQKMNVGMSDARRLIRTELNYVANRAALDSIKDSGMKYYRFIATLDRRTSTVCREHDGKNYSVEEGSPGTNMPPLHPHCRSTIAGSLKADSKPRGQRVAVGDDGRTYKVPADMTYNQWYEKYIKGVQRVGSNDIIKPSNLSDVGVGYMDLEQAKKRDRKIIINEISINRVPLVRVKGLSSADCELLQREHKDLLRVAMEQNNSNEVLALLSMDNKTSVKILGTETGVSPLSHPEGYSTISSAQRYTLAFLHNHPSTNNFSLADIVTFTQTKEIGLMSVVTNQGEVYILRKNTKFNYRKVLELLVKAYDAYNIQAKSHNEAVKMFLKDCTKWGVSYERSK